MSVPRAVIFANGEIPDLSAMGAILRQDDITICADGGLRYAVALGLHPRLLLGDLDSVDPAHLNTLMDQGVEIQRFPVEKDETDLEMAISWAIKHNFNPIVIAGGLGGRIDHTLGNLALLANPRFSELNMCLDDGSVEAFLIYQEARIQGHPGDLVSLLPVGDKVEGVETVSLRYPLRRETLIYHQTRGVSNEMLTSEALVRIESGRLLCIHTRQKQSGRQP